MKLARPREASIVCSSALSHLWKLKRVNLKELGVGDGEDRWMSVISAALYMQEAPSMLNYDLNPSKY